MFSGSYVAIVTPFNDNGDVDYKILANLVERHVCEGSDGVVPCGTTGEASTLSDEEQRKVIDVVVRAAAGRISVIAGVGSCDTKKSVAMARHAKDCGADGVMVVTPYYSKPTQQGCIAHVVEIAKVGVPIVLYNHPGRTGTRLSAETIETMGNIPEVVAVKEACGDVNIVMDIIQSSPIAVFSGDDNLTIPFMSVGAVGVISVVANIIPREWSAMVHKQREGRRDEALVDAYRYRCLCRALVSENNPRGVKYAMALLGLCSATTRLPITDISDGGKSAIRIAMEDAAISVAV